MKLLLILLLLVTNSLCYEPVAAASYLGSGFDSKTALFGLAPIFDYTYGRGEMWKNYKVPDQMSVHSYETTSEIVNQGIYKSYHEYIEMYERWFSFDVGISGQYFSAGFKYNETLGFIHEKMSEKFAEIIRGHHLWTYYVATLYPSSIMKFDPMFEKSLDLFPRIIKTDSDREYANQFIKTFGTHYCYRAVFGAKIDFNAAISQQITNSYSQNWYTTQYGFYFHYKLFNVSAGGFKDKTDITIDKTFLKNINADTFFLGGDPALANINNLTAWIKTIEKNPAPMNITLIGIWNLVSDSVKQNTMKNYIIEYLKTDLLTAPKTDFSCVGSGIDVTNLGGCLGNVYTPLVERTFVTSSPESELVKIEIVHKSEFNLEAWLDRTYSSAFGFAGIGTDTTEIHEYYRAYYKQNKSLVSVILQLAYQAISSPVLPMPTINPLFTMALNKLPPYSKSSQNMYFEFLKTWGTAVVDKVVLGGYFQVDMWYDREIANTYTESKIKEAAGWSLAGIIGDGHGHVDQKIVTDKRFAENLSYKYLYVGGSNSYNASEYGLWATTVRDDPQIIKYHLQPITYFITDDKKRLNMGLAIKEYCGMSVKELKDYIRDLINN